MKYNVIWSPDALTTFDDRLHYLRINWTEKEIENFKQLVQEYLIVLEESPYIGSVPGKQKNIYIGLIIKPVSLIYRVMDSKREIELVLFIDNRQNPKKIRKYKL